jgi:hypothetical protein
MVRHTFFLNSEWKKETTCFTFEFIPSQHHLAPLEDEYVRQVEFILLRVQSKRQEKLNITRVSIFNKDKESTVSWDFYPLEPQEELYIPTCFHYSEPIEAIVLDYTLQE